MFTISIRLKNNPEAWNHVREFSEKWTVLFCWTAAAEESSNETQGYGTFIICRWKAVTSSSHKYTSDSWLRHLLSAVLWSTGGPGAGRVPAPQLFEYWPSARFGPQTKTKQSRGHIRLIHVSAISYYLFRLQILFIAVFLRLRNSAIWTCVPRATQNGWAGRIWPPRPWVWHV